MSVNATRKRIAKARHRDQFSRVPSTTPFADILRLAGGIVPQSTPLMDYIMRKASR